MVCEQAEAAAGGAEHHRPGKSQAEAWCPPSTERLDWMTSRVPRCWKMRGWAVPGLCWGPVPCGTGIHPSCLLAHRTTFASGYVFRFRREGSELSLHRFLPPSRARILPALLSGRERAGSQPVLADGSQPHLCTVFSSVQWAGNSMCLPVCCQGQMGLRLLLEAW